MDIYRDEHGHFSSLLIVLLLIPVILLLIISFEQSAMMVDDSLDLLKSDLLDDVATNFEEEFRITSMKSLSNVSHDVLVSHTPLANASRTLSENILDSLNYTPYTTRGYTMDCNVISIKPSSDPFCVDIVYSINCHRTNDTSTSINRVNSLSVSIVNSSYPVYDPLPSIKTHASVVNNTYIFASSLSSFLSDTAYDGSVASAVISRCPYTDYASHGHDGSILCNCIDNHYYHYSHDGLCLMCRLEGRDECPHAGFETFIVPHNMVDEACVSVDHVLFNSSGHYNASRVPVNNSTWIYLDNGHRSKYGL